MYFSRKGARCPVDTGFAPTETKWRSQVMDKTTMSVQELSAQMGISLPEAYELVKKKDFPTTKVGTRILIPVDTFKEWLVITSNKEE